MSRRLLTLVTALACTAAITACNENLESGEGCPVLCPQAPIELRDTVIDAVVVDSTVSGFPALGFEDAPLLANRGDTLETRVIVRFDTLEVAYRPPDTTAAVPITSVDSAYLIVRLEYPLLDQPDFTIYAYDVDTILPEGSAADTTAATLAPLFRADRLLGSAAVLAPSITDSTIRIPIAPEKLLAKLADSSRLRIGLAIQNSPSASVRLAGQGDASTLALRYWVDPDTSVAPITMLPASRTPTDIFTARALADYQVTFRGTAPEPAGTVAVGGVPGRRTYLRFELPSNIVDSTRVVRAALLLTQAPNPLSALRTDTVTVYPDVVVADSNITNLERLLRFTSPTFSLQGVAFSIPSLGLVPADSGVRTIDMAYLIAAWNESPSKDAPRAIVLRAGDDRTAGATILFYSREAPADVRPRLRLTYAPRLEFGLP